jgi:hypothetical protein
MTLNDIFHTRQIDPRHVLVFRHRPHEPALRKVLPWLAAERPALFNAYQQTQGDKVERVMETMVGSGSVASFIGHEPGKALFVGLYSIVSSRPLTYDEFWKVREYREMKQFGLRGWVRDSTDKKRMLWFDLERTDFYESWRGKLVVNWPPPERSWWRRAHRNEIPVAAILEDSALAGSMPTWSDVELTWSDLGVLPVRWRDALSQWRGIYYIFDMSDGRAYVGSAYGESNLLGRWQNYASSGHGGNALLRGREPANFVFTILQRVSPDMDPTDVIALENSWKQRLHTRAPYGLNDN